MSSKVSGVLPKPRSIIMPYASRRGHPTGQGYADERMVPRGSHRWPKKKTAPSEQELMASRNPPRTSAKHASPRSEVHKWHLKMADLRKQYLADALVSADRADKAKDQYHRRYMAAAEKVKEAARGAGLTEAEMLTLPTISSLLSKSQLKKQTDDEYEQKRLERQYNDQLQQLKHEEERARVTVQLIDQADDFIVTEEQLVAGVEKAFVNGSSSGRNPVGGWSVTSFKEDSIMGVGRNSCGVEELVSKAGVEGEAKLTEIGDAIALELAGITNNGKPGLNRIAEILRGDQVLERAEKMRAKKMENVEDLAEIRQALKDME
ncbi:37S ribosomal protein PET123 [Yarrowia sp. C11]|nr:37S ribosomal protein [Yarrowia sp. E02]KAG5371961.1 37S ribosomal protein PET123 [Yarrowia sp. C11]